MEKKLAKKAAQPKPSFLKKNWHIIVIAILFLFGMSQCTRSCSRSQKIKAQTVEMAVKDSTISSLEQKIDTLKNNVNYYTALFESERSHNSNFASIATGNQAELYGKITDLEREKNSLEKEVKALSRENKTLRDSISAMQH